MMGLYDEVVDIAKLYLGPAAERFVTRQVEGHLNIKPSQLSAQHLEELAKWCSLSGKLVLPEDKAQEFGKKVQSLKR